MESGKVNFLLSFLLCNFANYKMKEYTVGFMFSEDKRKVLLIQKNRPQWQAGKLNGIGGKVEPQDDNNIFEAQCREFKEETGIETIPKDWEMFATIHGVETEDKTGTEVGSPYIIYCFRAFSNKIIDAKTMETEIPVIVKIDLLSYHRTLPNVQWLVPMAKVATTSLDIKYN